MFRVPYGDAELEFMLQPWFEVDIVESGSMSPLDDVPAAARAALAKPRGTSRLRELARDVVARRAGATAVIAVTDLTRACPDDSLVPPLLEELNAGGIADDHITVVIAVGLHRATTEAEKRTKLGPVGDRVRFIDSEGRDPSAWVDLGRTRTGG